MARLTARLTAQVPSTVRVMAKVQFGEILFDTSSAKGLRIVESKLKFFARNLRLSLVASNSSYKNTPLVWTKRDGISKIEPATPWNLSQGSQVILT